MHRNDAARMSRNNPVPIKTMIADADDLSPKQRTWLLDIYTRLSGSYDWFRQQEQRISAAGFRGPALAEFNNMSAMVQKELLDKVDTAYERVFPGDAMMFEPCYQHCDGEITFAVSEAMTRLRELILFHTDINVAERRERMVLQHA